MQLFSSSVGRKILMAITGQLMVLFVVVHLLGNSSIFIPGGINAYAEHLHSFPPLVWIFRLVMLVFVLVHAYYGITISLENSAANSGAYAVSRHLKAALTGKTMIWTGLLIALFVIGHITQFTARLTPDIVAKTLPNGGFDVFTMVTSSFQHGIVAFIYVLAMIFLCMHLFHGIQSFFQTMGWNNANSRPVISTIGKVVAVIFLIGYSTIPVFIFFRILA